MNDTLAIKPIVSANVTGAVVGSSRSFERIFGPENGLRSNSQLGSLNPTVVRISHQARTTDVGVQRSLFAVEQSLTRLDAASNPVRKDVVKVKFQAEIPGYVTEAEYVAAVEVLAGALLENGAALAKQIYQAQQ